MGGGPIHFLEGLEEGLLFGLAGSVSYKETDEPPDPSWLERELGLKSSVRQEAWGGVASAPVLSTETASTS